MFRSDQWDVCSFQKGNRAIVDLGRGEVAGIGGRGGRGGEAVVGMYRMRE